MAIEEILKNIVELCQKNQAECVYLFGSRAKGTCRERSDIDIAVTGVKEFERLKDEIDEIPTLYTIDLVNMDTCGNEFLLEDIGAYGRKIYEKV